MPAILRGGQNHVLIGFEDVIVYARFPDDGVIKAVHDKERHLNVGNPVERRDVSVVVISGFVLPYERDQQISFEIYSCRRKSRFVIQVSSCLLEQQVHLDVLVVFFHHIRHAFTDCYVVETEE